MLNVKKMIQVIILAIVIIILGNIESEASSDLFLNNLDFETKINQDGSMNVKEIWNIDIEDTNTLYKTFVIDKTKYSSISNVKVSRIIDDKIADLNETDSWSYHIEDNKYFGGFNNDGKFEIAFGVGLEDESDTRTYMIEYKVNSAIAKYFDYAELYWQFIGADFEIPARKVTGTIYLPKNVENKEEIKVWGHTEDLNGEIHAIGLNKIEFALDGFNPGKYVEIRTLFPTNVIDSSTRGEENIKILDKVVNEETVWANEANERREKKQREEFLASVAIIVVTLLISAIIFKNYLKYKKIEKALESKFIPTQDFLYYREIPRENATPAEAEYVRKESKSNFSEKQLGRIFSATLLDLSLKKIIEFKFDKNKKDKEAITIKILKQDAPELENNKDEKAIFEFLKESSVLQDEINIKELLKYIKSNTSKIIKLKDKIDINVKEKLINEETLDREHWEKYSKYIGNLTGYGVFSIVTLIFGICITFITSVYVLIGFIPLFLSLILASSELSKITKKINVYTQKGIDESHMWKGLEKYMEEFSMLDKREVPELVIWEKFLVYATAFGIADKVLEQLKIVYPYIDETLDINTYTYMYFMMNTNFSSSFSNAVSTSISSSYSSGTGSGGGFSGGGGGGRADGGGGGGR